MSINSPIINKYIINIVFKNRARKNKEIKKCSQGHARTSLFSTGMGKALGINQMTKHKTQQQIITSPNISAPQRLSLSILTCCISGWYDSCTPSDRKALQWVVKIARRVTGLGHRRQPLMPVKSSPDHQGFHPPQVQSVFFSAICNLEQTRTVHGPQTFRNKFFFRAVA